MVRGYGEKKSQMCNPDRHITDEQREKIEELQSNPNVYAPDWSKLKFSLDAPESVFLAPGVKDTTAKLANDGCNYVLDLDLETGFYAYVKHWYPFVEIDRDRGKYRMVRFIFCSVVPAALQ